MPPLHAVRFADSRLESRLDHVVDPEGRVAKAVGDLCARHGSEVAWWPFSGALPSGGAASADGDDPVAVGLDGLQSALPDGCGLIIVEDYGRDDVSSLLGGPERMRRLVGWSRPHGPFLSRGFKVRVLHCWWRWPSLAEAQAFLGEAFGEQGRAVSGGLRSPRLAWKVALYHRAPREAAQ